MTIETFPENSDLSKLKRVKFGIDPTAPNLHLGHLVPLRIVRKMQEEGKHVTIVLGTFTAQMGDPSGKDKTRPILSKQEVEDNADFILDQLKDILLPNFKVFRNGDLFNIMNVPSLLEIVSKFTVNKVLSRNAFQERIKHNNSIGLHELIVPILQGQDSVHLKTEIEIGGSDQLFNFQIARELQIHNKTKPEVCVLSPIINGTDGRKMSKSLNNCIFFSDKAEDIFGKCMSISDETMEEWIPLLTDNKDFHINEPFIRKKRLSFKIVNQIKGKDEAIKALDIFENLSQKSSVPDDIEEFKLDNIIDIVCLIRKCSRSEARRLFKSNAISVNNIKIAEDFELKIGDIIKAGKRNFGLVI